MQEARKLFEFCAPWKLDSPLLKPQGRDHASVCTQSAHGTTPSKLCTQTPVFLSPSFLSLISFHFLYLQTVRKYSRFKSFHLSSLPSQSIWETPSSSNTIKGERTSKLLGFLFDCLLLPPAARRGEKTKACLNDLPGFWGVEAVGKEVELCRRRPHSIPGSAPQRVQV